MGKDVFCPKCNSKNILIQKGDGYKINGADFIAIICHNCKKVYGFYDVKCCWRIMGNNHWLV